MNEINFELRDVEAIDLTMGMGIKKVYPPIENLEVIPTKEQQIFNHENSYGYDEVIVEPIPDEYIIPDGTLPITENATYDVRRFARVSTAVKPAPVLQDKALTINENGTHDITYDEGYDGLNQVSVTVDAIEDLSEELTDYGNGLTRQGVTIDDITKALQNKAISGGDDMVRYSKDEIVIGTWINDKPLYRRVYEFDVEAKTNITITKSELGTESAEHMLINMGSSVALYYSTNRNSHGFSSVSYYLTSSDRGHVYINMDKSLVIQNQNETPRKYYIVLEYTKTTD